jgi:DNA invertase Pin-like site-specific DNA recombinase
MEVTMRVVLYARENLQGRARLAKQLKALRNYCARRGWKVVGEYSEVGDANGKGSQLRAMLMASRQGKFTHILVHDLARLSRSTGTLLDIIDDLTQQEIELVTTGWLFVRGYDDKPGHSTTAVHL